MKIHVDSKQAYVFVDGKAIRDGSQTINLAARDHKIGVYNYGYMPKTQDVHVAAGETTNLRVTLQSSEDKLEGPFADIEFKGDPRAAVLLNGQRLPSNVFCSSGVRRNSFQHRLSTSI